MRNKIIFPVIILIIISIVGYFIWVDWQSATQSVEHSVFNNTLETGEVSSVPTDTEALVDNAEPDTYIKHSVSNIEAEAPIIEIPSLDRPIEFTVDMSDEAKDLYRTKINEKVSELKENSDFFNSWLVLGIYRKQTGDYEGAREVWNYAAKIRPLSSTPFNNLGDLYAYYIKDNQKAEENFLKAIENSPNQVYIYRSLYDFYRYVIENDDKAKDVLILGIIANPEISQDLQYLLNNY